MADAPELDPLGRDFARLAFGIERHVPGFIDAWLGADEMRAALEQAASPPPAALVADARELLDRIAVTPLPERRRDYLTGQVEAMLATARRLAGEEIPYREEVRLLVDIEPAATPGTSSSRRVRGNEAKNRSTSSDEILPPGAAAGQRYHERGMETVNR